MARKNKKERIVLENIELKPQVIGQVYKNKSNIWRVMLVLVVFILVIVYINDISIFINKLIGKDSAESIEHLAGNKNDKGNISKEDVFNIFNNNLIIQEENFSLNNFYLDNNILTFDIVNNSEEKIDLSSKKYFLEMYNRSKTLLERFKIDISTINSKSKISYELNVSKGFHYIVLVEKTVADYPEVTLNTAENGIAVLKCVKGNEHIVYNFKNDKLESIKHTITDNNVSDESYYAKYNAYQSKVNSYNNVTGFNATFNGTLNGFTAIFDIDLKNTNLNNILEKYYYAYDEKPKVVKFEMQTYGFSCN